MHGYRCSSLRAWESTNSTGTSACPHVGSRHDSHLQAEEHVRSSIMSEDVYVQRHRSSLTDGLAEMQTTASRQVQHPFGHFNFHPKTQFERYVPFARTTSNDLRYTAPSLAFTTDMTTTPIQESSSLKHPIPSVMVRLGILSRRGIPERLLAFNPKRPSSLNRPLYSACTPLYESIIATTNLVISSDRG